MKKAAVGLRVHSGWAAMVAIRVERGEPRILGRERVHLVETFTYEFRQPYHTAQKKPFGSAREFVDRVEAEAGRLSYLAIRGLEAKLMKEGFQLTSCGLLIGSGKTLPSFEKILASHALIHAADGELFRTALSHAGVRCGLEMVLIREKELLEQAWRALRVRPARLLGRMTKLGKPFGPPWSQDEKFSTLAAWLSLGHAPKRLEKASAGAA